MPGRMFPWGSTEVFQMESEVLACPRAGMLSLSHQKGSDVREETQLLTRGSALQNTQQS